MGTIYAGCGHEIETKEEKEFLAVKTYREQEKIVQYGTFCLECVEKLKQEDRILKNAKEESKWLFD